MKLLTIILLLFSTSLYSITHLYELGHKIGNGTEPQGPSPWITASFADNGANNVQLTLSAGNLVGSEYIDAWYFNFDPSVNVNQLQFTKTSGFLSVGSASLSLGQNAFLASDGGNFDAKIDFPNFLFKFNSGDSVTFDVSLLDGNLNASMFNFGSTGGEGGSFYTAAQIKDISEGSGSGWVGAEVSAPEPSTYLMLGTFLVAVFCIQRLKRKKAV